MTDREILLEAETKAFRGEVASVFAAQAEALIAELRQYESRFATEGPIRDREYESALDAALAETNETLAEAFGVHAGEAMALGGAAAITELQLSVEFRFDLENPRAVRYLEQAGARMVTAVSETTKGRIRRVILEAFEDEVSWKELAKRIRTGFRNMGARKPQKHIRDRAELIAVTELGNAFEEAGMVAAKDLAAGGLLMEKKWLHTGDERVTPECRANAARGWVPLAEIFPSGHGRPLRFPGCRCALSRRMQRDR